MKTSVIRGTARATLVAAAVVLAAMPARAAGDDAETKASPHCENVQITVRNQSGQAIKLISVDYSTSRTWKRGRIVFRTIDDGASHTWTGSFKDMAGLKASFRVNTRYVIDAQTDRYSDLKSTTVTTAACTSEETHEVAIGKP